MMSRLRSARQTARLDAAAILPTVVFLMVYLALGAHAPFGVDGLVWACVAHGLSSAVVRLPLRRRLLRDHADGARLGLVAWVAIGLMLTLQIAQNDAVFSMRLWTLALCGLAAVYLAVFLFARGKVRRLPIPLRRNEAAHAVVVPMEVLRLVGFAVLNEAVIATGDELLWVSARALVPVLLTPVVRCALLRPAGGRN